jgi:hypothetical protein
MKPSTQLARRKPSPAVAAPPPPAFPCAVHPDTPLLQLSSREQDVWSLRDAYEGVLVFGGTGSGKTSGSGQALLHTFLAAGMGGIVLCAKVGEADMWQRLATEMGRGKHVIRFDASGDFRFNFLEYEMHRDALPADVLATNVVNTLLNVLEVASRGVGLSANTQSGDAFWQKSSKMLLGYAVDLLYATTGRVRLAEIMELIESAPTSIEQMRDEQWQESSLFYDVFRAFYATGGGRFPPAPEDAARLKNYWTKNFPNMAEKTRSNIISTLVADLDPLLRGRMRKIFSTETNVVPELTHDGAIILLDFPVKEWAESGILAQQIFKFLWQRATERRKVTDTTRPVFCWADECQFFLSGYDLEFQSTARSSRACTVLLTQNLPTFYSRIGGQNPEHAANALIGNLRTKIFHSNNDNVTNKWAAEMIGKETVWRATHGQNDGQSISLSEQDQSGISSGASKSYSYQINPDSRNSYSISYGTNVGDSSGTSSARSQSQSSGSSYSVAEQRDFALDPEYFSRELLTGGERNGCIVSGVLVQSGRKFAHNGRNWMHVRFSQN